jgi:hypothetical protein
MSDLKEKKVAELQIQHGLPAEILARCVSDDGAVDAERLGLALQATNFGMSGRSGANQAEIEQLRGQLSELETAAKTPGVNMMALVPRIMAAKRRLQTLGAQPQD